MPKSNKIELNAEQQKLFNELKKLSKRANQRIVRLEREFGKDTWATRYLKNKLEAEPLQAWTRSGRVKVNKRMTIPQMEATIKATKEFLNKPTSTRRGIKKARKKGIETLKTRYGGKTTADDMSYEEAEALYNLFDDDDVNGITNFIKGSDVLAIIEEAREENYSKQNFVSIMQMYKQYNGKGNFEQLVNKIYSKYVYRGQEDQEEYFNNNYEDMIEEATTKEELEELENILISLYYDGDITPEEYTNLMDKLEVRKNEIL